jgi:adenosine kinase
MAYDRIMDFPGRFSDHILPDKIHILNVCFTVNGLKEQFGGTAGNIAYNLVLLGERPQILAAVGKDFDRYEAWLSQLQLPLEGIRSISEELTAGAYITTDKADNQITGFNPGAMKHPSHFSFDGINPASALTIISPGNLEDMLTYAKTCREERIPYIFDPGQSIPSFTGDELMSMLKGSSLLISNDYELEMVMRATGIKRPDLLQFTGKVITTLGEKGSIVFTPEDEVKIPAAQAARVTDPTGAGDAYRAGLIKGIVTGKDLREAARLGAVCASFAVECYGTQEHRFSQKDFWARYEEAFGAPASADPFTSPL